MKKKLFFVPLLLCLAIFGDSRPGLASSLNPIPTDLLIRLEKEGWKTAAPGVMQHTVGSTVETLGFGDDGLRFKVKELKAHSYRYPATKNSGSAMGAGCIPAGSRVFLDSSADCSTVSPVGEKAICYALQKYGAYMTATSKDVFNLDLEIPTDGQPGDSGPNPYHGVGLGENLGLPNIPWFKLKVAADCRCSSSDLTATGGRPFAQKAASNAPLPGSPKLDVNSAAIVTNLNSSGHTARHHERRDLYGNRLHSRGQPRLPGQLRGLLRRLPGRPEGRLLRAQEIWSVRDPNDGRGVHLRVRGADLRTAGRLGDRSVSRRRD
jgi:hypothetical protein